MSIRPLFVFLLGSMLIHNTMAACDTTINITNQCEDAGNEYSDLLINMDLVQTALTTVTGLDIVQLQNKFTAVKNAINAELDRLYTSASACCDGNKDDPTCSCHGKELTSYFYSPQNDLLHYQPERCGCYHGPCGCKNGERQGYPAPMGTIDTKCLPPPSCIPLHWHAYPGWSVPVRLAVIGSGMTVDECFQLCRSQPDCYGVTYQGEGKVCLKITEEAACDQPMIPSACCYTILKKLCEPDEPPVEQCQCLHVCRPNTTWPWPAGYDINFNCPAGYNDRTVHAAYLTPDNLLDGALGVCHYQGNIPGPAVCGGPDFVHMYAGVNEFIEDCCPAPTQICDLSNVIPPYLDDVTLAQAVFWNDEDDSGMVGCAISDPHAYNCLEIQYCCSVNPISFHCTHFCRPEVFGDPGGGYDIHFNCPEGYNSRTVVNIYLSPDNLLEGDPDMCHYEGSNPTSAVCGGPKFSDGINGMNGLIQSLCPAPVETCSITDILNLDADTVANWIWYGDEPASADGCPNDNIDDYNCFEVQYLCEQVPVFPDNERCLHVCNPGMFEIPSGYSVHLDCPDGYTDREVHSIYLTTDNLWAANTGQCRYQGTNPLPEVCGGLFSSQEAYDHAHIFYPTVCIPPAQDCNLSDVYSGGTTALVNDMWTHNIPIQIDPADCPDPGLNYICLEYRYTCTIA